MKYFLEVAASQHVTRSAEKLHIAQPALTQAIHRLEKELKKNTAELDKLETKLQNPGFVNKAPANVVQAERERAEKLTALIAKLEESAAAL